jgi:hypothetical protein
VKVRIMGRIQRSPTPHTAWCTRDHRCGVNEHRSPDRIADELGARAVITRVRAGGTDYAEIRARVPLSGLDLIARHQVGLTLRLMRRLFRAIAAVRPEALPTAAHRPALDRRSAA